jgi:uncharacterized lipoprotein
MKTIVQLLTLTLITLSLSACGKSSEVKAQDQAKNQTAEQNALAKELNATGMPRSSWSDAELNTYEAKLNRLEALEAALSQANGKNGVVVFNGDNRRFFSQARMSLALARSEKARAAQNADSKTTP